MAALERSWRWPQSGRRAIPVRRSGGAGCARSQRGIRRLSGAAGAGELPWTIMPGLDATDSREQAFSSEPFCSILSETE